MCICGLKRTIFRNGTLKSSINTGRYTADYLQCGNLPYLAWKKRMTAHILSYRRIRRYLALSLKATEEHVTLVMWDPLSWLGFVTKFVTVDFTPIFRNLFLNAKNTETLDFQEFRRPCQVVEVTGFEPAASASRTQRSTKLSHTSLFVSSFNARHIIL